MSPSEVLFVAALLGLGGLAFMTSSSLAAMYQLPIWAAASLGALSFPVAGLVWDLARERARPTSSRRWLTRAARLAARQLVVIGALLGVAFGPLESTTKQALAEHRGWIVGSTQQRTAAGCDVRGGHHPEWRGDLEAARAQARREDAPLLIYFTADWCGYCETLQRETLCAPEIAETLNHELVALRLNDRDLSEETRAEFKVTGFPKLLLLGADGRPRSRGPSGWERATVDAWLKRQIETHARERAEPSAERSP